MAHCHLKQLVLSLFSLLLTPRTKACDLCYNKRIKCDVKKPRCSHCVVYDVECTYTAASRKAVPKNQGSRRREEVLQSRLESLEAQLRSVSEKVDKLESLALQDPTAHQPLMSMHEDFGRPGNSPHRISMNLPPLEEFLPIIENYLATFNSILPLFHPSTLLHTVKEWYRHPREREEATWAAINVALALAHRQSDGSESNPNKKIAEYFDNAQSVLTQVVMSDTDLVNVQVLVGLVMLFQGTQNLKPSTILIATALRMAHGLRLHTKTSSVHLSRSEALQRDRVFWIAYILDKDISMRARQPPIQLDADVDLDLPLEEPADDDDIGFFFTTDGRSKMNFFRARVQLARIQGSVYDCLYSARSQNLSPEQQAQNVLRIRGMLDDWASHVPAEFNPGTVSQAGQSELSRFFCVLYATRLSCLAIISKVHSWDLQWVQDLQDYGRRAAAGEEAPQVSLLQDWQAFVDESRDFIKLFMSVLRKDSAFIW